MVLQAMGSCPTREVYLTCLLANDVALSVVGPFRQARATLPIPPLKTSPNRPSTSSSSLHLQHTASSDLLLIL
jgi:hypothetical protein